MKENPAEFSFIQFIGLLIIINSLFASAAAQYWKGKTSIPLTLIACFFGFALVLHQSISEISIGKEGAKFQTALSKAQKAAADATDSASRIAVMEVAIAKHRDDIKAQAEAAQRLKTQIQEVATETLETQKNLNRRLSKIEPIKQNNRLLSDEPNIFSQSIVGLVEKFRSNPPLRIHLLANGTSEPYVRVCGERLNSVFKTAGAVVNYEAIPFVGISPPPPTGVEVIFNGKPTKLMEEAVNQLFKELGQEPRVQITSPEPSSNFDIGIEIFN
jgi:hypothetical protein